MIKVLAKPNSRIKLGRLGENEHRMICFPDTAELLQMYPDAEITLLHQRPTDPAGYPVNPDCVTVADGMVCWLLQSGDLAFAGRGQCEIILTENGVIAKDIFYDTDIQPALDGSGSPPDPWSGWVQKMVQDSRNAAQEIVDGLGLSALKRVSSLTDAEITAGDAIEAVGIPVYVEDPETYTSYGISASGWYLFVRVAAKEGSSVTGSTSVEGADGLILEEGADHVDLAVRFEAAASSKRVSILWGDYTDSFVFKATDLAVRNLDYLSTFYIYDIAPYTTWTYALTTDATFTADKNYYTLDPETGKYTLTEVTAGQTVPANTYYNHSKVHFEGMTKNVTYRLDEIVDCPVEIALPEVAEDGHGSWFEIQMRYGASYSCTLLPPAGVKIGTAQTQAQTAGINTIDLQYTDVDGVKMWTLLNTHSNIPA